ncbi:MAG: flagellar hook-associated protein FlgK [Gammaproteobacteria bacterium]|nr:MAG: flagellar hook-associated protein FlgK [Gammaproteobacteria bacterium]
MPVGDILGTGISGLLAFQRSLTGASHNIANVNTEGYNRQRVELGARPPQPSGAGYIGQGVQVEGVRRIYDEFLSLQVRINTSANAQLQSFYSQASQLDNLLADPQAGLTPSLQDFFNAVQGLANDPASIPARQVLLSNGENLVERLHALDQRMRDLRGAINSQLQASVSEINSFAQAIAKVNQAISLAQGVAGGEPPNDLLDQRDALIVKLSELIGVTTVAQDNGMVNVFIGSGQTLVAGTQTSALSAVKNPYDPIRYEIAYQNSSGAISDSLTGGKLGGVLQFRSQILDSAQNALGRVATGLALTFNAQHREGQDLNGALGADFFNAAPPQTFAHSGNTGNAVVGVTLASASALTGSDYLLQRGSGGYTLTRLSDNTVTTLTTFPGGAQTVDGVTLNLSSGALNVGDRFLIQPTRNGAAGINVAVRDTRLIAAAAPVRSSAALANTGGATISAGEILDSTHSALLNTVTITFNNPPATFTVTGVAPDPSPLAYTSGGNIDLNGWRIQITGAPQAGDSFTVERNTSGVSDNRNALLLAGLRTQLTLAGGNASYQDAYGQLVADVGSSTHQADIGRKAQETQLAQVKNARDATSGVNLEEEAADLVRFQQAYQAAAQVISIADTLFQSLLLALRR